MSGNFFRLSLIVSAIEIIQKRMVEIQKPEDFITNDYGLTLLDSINARLQTIGENLNKVFRSDEELVKEKLNIDPLPIIDFRNIISHEYELLDYQIIYNICISDLPILKQKIQTFLSGNNESV